MKRTLRVIDNYNGKELITMVFTNYDEMRAMLKRLRQNCIDCSIEQYRGKIEENSSPLYTWQSYR